MLDSVLNKLYQKQTPNTSVLMQNLLLATRVALPTHQVDMYNVDGSYLQLYRPVDINDRIPSRKARSLWIMVDLNG